MQASCCALLAIGIQLLEQGATLFRLILLAEDLADITPFTATIGIFIICTVFLISWTLLGFFSTLHESKCMLGPYIGM